MTRAEAIRKVARLLALAARSPSPHEAASATAAARRIMESQNITEADMRSAEEVGAQYTRVESAGRWSIDVIIISEILSGHFAVCVAERCFKSRRRRRRSARRELHVVGLPHHVEIAVHVYKFLRQAFRTQWAQARRSYHLPASDRRAFVLEMGRGICNRLAGDREAAAPSVSAIEVSLARHAEWLRQQVTKGRARRFDVGYSNPATPVVGFELGRRTSIRRAIGQEAVA